MPTPKIIALGESVADFIEISDPNPNLENTDNFSTLGNFTVKPGGAPLNVAIAFNRIVENKDNISAIISQVGKDVFGKQIAKLFDTEKVNTTNLIQRDNTVLAIVKKIILNQQEETNEYSFYNTDIPFFVEDLDENLFQEADILHLTSLFASTPQGWEVTQKALKLAQENDVLVSFDINHRPFFWSDQTLAKEIILKIARQADILKMNIEELDFLQARKVENSEVEKVAREYLSDKNKLALITNGGFGCFYLTADNFGCIDSYKVKSVDPTGAGDTFIGAFLVKVFEDKEVLENISKLEEAIRFANIAGAMATTGAGAVPSMPNRQEIENFLEK